MQSIQQITLECEAFKSIEMYGKILQISSKLF